MIHVDTNMYHFCTIVKRKTSLHICSCKCQDNKNYHTCTSSNIASNEYTALSCIMINKCAHLFLQLKFATKRLYKVNEDRQMLKNCSVVAFNYLQFKNKMNDLF